MNTNTYVTPDQILSTAAAMVGDKTYQVIPFGFYMSMVQEAFEKLALDTFFHEERVNIDFPKESLTVSLPKGCFNVKNIYLFNGPECRITDSKKIYWKRNYYTEGGGYIANNKGAHTRRDPFINSRYGHNNYHSNHSHEQHGAENALFYNIQMGNLMLSSSCRGQGEKIHIHFNSTGCEIGEAPIIPIYLRTAIEDFVTEAALRFRMANDPGNIRTWASLQQLYDKRLNDPYNGSWQAAETRVKSLNSSQREELHTYLGRMDYGSGR